MIKKGTALLLIALSIGFPAAFGAGWIGATVSRTHDPNADPYKYCFKVNTAEIPPQFRFGLPNGTYAVCRLGP